jgi:peroxiredoxin
MLTASPILAPDFTLPTHAGGALTLSDSVGPLGAVLVFFRGHWCPYCRRYLGKVQANYARFVERGATVIGVSPEPAATSAGLARELGLAFPLCSDADCAVIERYGVRNNFAGAAPFLPHPAVVVMGADRAVQFKSVDRNYKRRTPVPSLFRALDQIEAAGRH